MYATFFIPAENSESLKSKLDKLATKARKLGCAAITWNLAQTFTRPHPDKERADKGEILAYEAITIQGTAPHLNGWVFVGTLDHEILANGTAVAVIRSHNEECVPERFRTATPDQCGHCKTNRKRKNTFILRNESTGEWVQVGRSCLKDFLGYHTSPAALARYAAFLCSTDAFCKEFAEELDDYAVGETYLDLTEYLAWVAQSINDSGWSSRSQARDTGGMATADFVWTRLMAKTQITKEQYAVPAPVDATYAEVKDALAWLAAQDSAGNDYIHNCQAIAALGAVKWANAGYAASILSSYRRAVDRQLQIEVLKASGVDHVGTVGTREEFRVTLIACIRIEGHYGTSFLHKFADPNGNAITWFSSNPRVVEGELMIVGASYKVDATTKDHGEYNGQAQTKVVRITVKPLGKVRKARKAKKVA